MRSCSGLYNKEIMAEYSITKFTIFSLFFFCCLQRSQCEVTVEIKSQVVLLNTNATFSCAGTGDELLQITGPSISGAITVDFAALTPKYFSEQKINISRSKDSDIKRYDIEIFTEIENNQTVFSCSFDDDHVGFTTATLYIAKDELGEVKGFQNPSATYNKTSASLQVSWSPPWSHLVNSYTLTMHNKSDNTWNEYTIEDGTTWSLVNTTSTDTRNCPDLMIFVTAHTDIGDAKSNIIATGVPIELGTISARDVDVQLLMDKSGSLQADITFDAPIHCSSFQHVMYNFTVYHLQNDSQPAIMTMIREIGPLSIPKLSLEEVIQTNNSYCVEIIYWDDELLNTDSSRKNVTKYFYANFPNMLINGISTDPPVIISPSLSKVTLSSSTAPSNCNTVVYNAATAQSSIPLYVIAAVGSVLFILLSLCVLAIVAILLKTRSRRGVRCSEDVISDVVGVKEMPSKVEDKFTSAQKLSTTKKTRKTSVPQMMATNPLYEGTASLYSTVPDPASLKTPTNVTTSYPTRRVSETCLGIPPQLPPPRKMSLDSPGVKSGVQLSLDKQMFLEGNDCHDQYVSMQSASEIRYAKSPLMKSKTISEEPWNSDLNCSKFTQENEEGFIKT